MPMQAHFILKSHSAGSRDRKLSLELNLSCWLLARNPILIPVQFLIRIETCSKEFRDKSAKHPTGNYCTRVRITFSQHCSQVEIKRLQEGHHIFALLFSELDFAFGALVLISHPAPQVFPFIKVYIEGSGLLSLRLCRP